MLQIVFNEISAAEISRLGTLEQLELFEEFQVSESSLKDIDGKTFGKLEHNGKMLYRFRSSDYRIYFEIIDGQVIVHRVLHKNSFKDFLFRSNISKDEDQELAESKSFWQLIEEGQNAQRKS